MFVVSNGKPGSVIRLSGNKVLITDSVGGQCVADPSLNAKVPLHRLVDNGPEKLHPRKTLTKELGREDRTDGRGACDRVVD